MQATKRAFAASVMTVLLAAGIIGAPLAEAQQDCPPPNGCWAYVQETAEETAGRITHFHVHDDGEPVSPFMYVEESGALHVHVRAA